MGQLSDITAAPDQVAYMDTAAATPVGVDYKRRFVEALGLRAGQTVADIGCGPGTDLGLLADSVGRDGSVIGVDHEPRMLEEARRRRRELVRLSVHAGLRVRSVEPIAVLFRDLETTDKILGLRRNAARAVQDGVLAEPDAEAWVRRLASGPVVAGFTFYLVTSERTR